MALAILMDNQQKLSGYHEALSGVAYYPQVRVGCLRISDRDRLDFLQRQTTNDIRRLSVNQSVVTILVSANARILDVLRLIMDGEDILALTLPGTGSETANFLKSRIFFMDQVQVADVSNQVGQLDLEGPGIGDFLGSLGIDTAPRIDEVRSIEVEGIPVKLIGHTGLSGPGIRMVAPAYTVAALKSAFQSRGAVTLDEASYQVLRVEAGLPLAGSEITPDYTPLEAGLRHYVSESKGCYTGQEVIARQITYDKITRHLVGLKLESIVQPKTRIYAEGKPVGQITSAVNSPRFGPIALAIIKRPYNQPGSHLSIDDHPEDGNLQASVVDLPFSTST